MRTLILAGALLAAAPAMAQPTSVTGRWVTEDGKALVEISNCGASLCGKIAQILIRDPSKPTTDAYNPDKTKRSRPILGLPILTEFAPSGEYWKGQIYDPKSGKTYRSYLQNEGTTLKVQGCIAMFCQTQHWRRAK